MTKRNRLSWGDDQEVFQMALSRIPTDGRAFCTVIVPSNMHADYTIDETINCSVDFARDYDAKCHEYFRRARYLDYQIADFIKGLKERGLYEETLIVVTSDHQVPPNFYSNSMKSALSPYFPTMFINTGCDWTENNEKNKDVVFCHSQAYPTMLLLMGLKPREYAGLFPPMTDIPASMEYEFDNCQYLTTNDARLKNIYHLQEKIIRSSYFGKK